MSSKDWDRIHTWLGEHAPKILNTLNPGASNDEIAAAEKAIGVSLPVAWKDLYAQHNGLNSTSNQSNLFHALDFLPLKAVLTERELIAGGGAPEPVKAADAGIETHDIRNQHWVPIANDWGDVSILVDLQPGSGGTLGQVIATDLVYRVAIMLAPSMEAFIKNFADDLEQGLYSLNQEALADGNEFLDCAPEIDLSNWWKSPRWKHLEK